MLEGFGSPQDLETGLVNAESEQDFKVLVESVKEVWDQRLKPYNSPPQFHSWFIKYCKDKVKDTMLKPKRISAVLEFHQSLTTQCARTPRFFSKAPPLRSTCSYIM